MVMSTPAQNRVEASAAESSDCAHCGLPLAPPLVRVGEELQFCCVACESVHRMICEVGLGDYYALRSQLTGEQAAPQARQADRTDCRYGDFESPAFLSEHAQELPMGSRRIELYLAGVHCAACLWLVEKLPQLLDGVQQARLDLGRRVLEVCWQPARVSLSEIARTLDALGYPPRPYSRLSVQAACRAEERRLLLRLGVAGAVAGNVMLLSFALYSAAFQGMESQFRRLFEVSCLVVSFPALSYSAWEFYRGAWSSLKTRTPHMDLPVSLGIVVGAIWGAYSVLTGAGEVYFDTVTALVFLLLTGRYLELRQQNRAREAVERAQMLTPARARVLTAAGDVEEVLVEDVAVDTTVLVKIGETLPVDGVVLQGESELDNRLLTGESRPVSVSERSRVFAGATNLSGPLRIRATRAGGASRVARLMREVERSRARRAPLVRAADRLAGKFIVVVLLLAAGTLVGWSLLDPARAIEHTIAVLIVACPCALGLATPLAVSAALGRAAERQMLIKGGDVLEAVSAPCAMVFDKTGTLTTGKLRLTAWRGERAVQSAVRAIESQSAHPIAQALCRGLPSDPALSVEASSEVPGGGIRGRVAGRDVLVGAPSWLQRQGIDLPSWAVRTITRHGRLGHTPVGVVADGSLVALAFLDDPLEADAAESLKELKRQGYRLSVLSGDHPAVTERVARELSRIAHEPSLFDEVVGGVGPEAKLAFVKRCKALQAVVVVGDGVNDAAALAEANVGVAVHGGAEASLLAADVYLGKRGIRQLVSLVQGARRTLVTIRWGILVSLAYNIVGVSLAIAGWLGPLAAAILMPLSSLSVVTIAYRARAFGGVG